MEIKYYDNCFRPLGDCHCNLQERLEGYELAYEVILKSNKRLEKENKELKDELIKYVILYANVKGWV